MKSKSYAQFTRGFSGIVLIGLLLTGLAVFVSSSAAQTTTFRNPLNSQRGADPWMRYYNGQYYLTTSTYSSDANVGITMKRGATIAELKNATPQRIWQDSTASRCCNIWAPEFHLLNGPNGPRWYMYYVAGVSANVNTQRMHVLESAGLDPMGPYTYRGQLNAGGPTDPWVTDPTIMTINGQIYLFYTAYEGVHFQSSQNIYGVALSNPWTISGSPALISRPQFSWETQTAAVNEAPVQLTAPNGTIYMVFSASWCGNPNYQLGRATYIGGPVLSQSSWVKHSSPIFSQANGQSSTAHNGFFKSPDGTEDWIVYHGVNNTNGDCGPTLRTTRIQKFTWNTDNTPNMGSPLALTTDITVPSGEGGGPTPTPTPVTPTSTPIPSQQDPIVWYKFDEGSGAIAADSSGNGKNGTLVNGPTWVGGAIGNALNLDGSNDYVSMPTGVVNGLNNFTIATWVNLDSVSNWARVFDFGAGTTVNMFLTPRNSLTGVVRFAITTSGNGAEQPINGSAPLPTGAWTHVAVTRSGNTGTLYVNGAIVGSNNNMTLNPSSLGNTNQNWIGRSQYPDPYLDGRVDDFRIYNRALSASEVNNLASPGQPTPTSTNTPIATPTNTPTATPTNTPTATPTNTPTATPTSPAAGDPIPQGNWSLLFVDSQELSGENGAATNAFDGATNTIWHTQWQGANPPHPHEIQIDLGATYDVTGFRYLPRQGSVLNGTIAQYEFYVSTDSSNWGSTVASGAFASNNSEKAVGFAAKTGRYVRLRALSEVNGNPWTSAAEINVLGTLNGEPTPTPTVTATPGGETNLALDATASTSHVSPWETLAALNDGFDPAHSNDRAHGVYGNWPETGVEWVQYDFDEAHTVNRMAVFWFDDNQGIDLPASAVLKYWNGGSFVNVPNPSGYGTAGNQYNETTFDPVTTDSVRLEITSNGSFSTGIIEWQVFGN